MDLASVEYVALTGDHWTSVTNNNYLGVTAHSITKSWKVMSFALTLMITEERHFVELELIVNQSKLDLIMHPVVLKLITVKWNLYGRTGAWILLLLNFLFIVSWTTVAISVSGSHEEGDRYVLPQDWWRVLLVVLALVLTVTEVYREVMEIVRSHRKLNHWQRWAVQKVNEDLSCSHPMWPEERIYLEGQMKLIRNLKGTYSQNPWNIFDWLVYVLLLSVLGIHFADVFLMSNSLRQNSLRLFAVSIIFLWLRLMKQVRAFR